MTVPRRATPAPGQTVTYLNRKGVEQLLKSSDVRGYLTGLAEDVLREAVSSAPVVTGTYRDGLHIEQDTTDRVAVRVKGATDYDWFVEADYGTLSRAMDAAGVRRSSGGKR